MQDVLALILGGGRGTRFYPLTLTRSEPAVPLAGKYRLIDVPISHCINSGVPRVYVLTQFLSVSLHRHIAATYKGDAFRRGFVEVLAAQQTNEVAEWYKGTADALRQNLRYVQDDPCREVLVLSGDQLYRMDYRQLLRTHQESNADVTVAVYPVRADRAAGVGVLRLDEKLRVTQLVEKPQTEAQRTPLRTPKEWLTAHGVKANDREYLANMGIYLFKREALFDLLHSQPDAKDLVRDLLPPVLSSRASRPTCSTATGKTWARSSRTTPPTWPWPATPPRSTSTAPRASSTRACATSPRRACARSGRALPAQRRLRHCAGRSAAAVRHRPA